MLYANMLKIGKTDFKTYRIFGNWVAERKYHKKIFIMGWR
jgi:hypothetical protein